MEELAYRIRAAEPEDVPELRRTIQATMLHPDGKGKRGSYMPAIQRNELLVLEQYDRRERVWRITGFIEYHLRVDDSITIKDAGSAGEAPHSAVIKHLIGELLRSAAPPTATAKVRSDAMAWNELLESIPGFSPQGKEYRRPHYYVIWEWSAEAAAREARRLQPRGRRQR